MPVIKVENLSKKYLIRHQQHERYTALRDVIANKAKGMFNRGIVQPWKRLTSNSTIQQINNSTDPHSPNLTFQQSSSSTTEEFWALKDVNFEVKRGDRVGIIGRNGAGKTTLLKLLSRITEPTSGRIEITGRVASLLEVGTGFHPELTGRENIFLNGAILGMGKSEIKRKFDEIVDFAEIEKFLDTPVKRYSSGMYVRLAFAVAAHLEPEILLVDEVLAVGDAQFQKKCLGKMEDVSKEGRTLFFVSHNLAAVQSLCNRGFVLHQGTMLLDGQTEKAVTFYMQNNDADSMSGSVSLLKRRDRKGNGNARVVSLALYSKEGIETNSIGMGEDFSVTLEIEGKLKNAVIGILIGNLFMRQICRGYTYESYPGEINIDGKLTVECRFKKIPLVQGTYNIHTWVGGIAGECADEVDNALELNIIEKDIFNTGKELNKAHNMFFVRHQWNFR